MKWWGVAAGAVAMTGVLVVGVHEDDAQASKVERCRAITAASESRRLQVAGEGMRVAVIGDSYSQGLDLADPTESWPSRLSGRVWVDGFAGSGFSAQASPCSGVGYAGRVARALATEPDLVVVQGGLNDYDVPTDLVRAGAQETLRLLEGRQVVVVGPASAPRRLDQVERIDSVLAEVAAEAGVPYVRTADWPLEFLDDRLHLTEDGHRVFGGAVARRIAELGLS